MAGSSAGGCLRLFLPLVFVLGACTGDKYGVVVTDDTADVPTDADGDGYFTPEDCDDSDPAVYPGAEELCDGVNNDCDGAVDESDATDATTWYRDGDGDGYSTPDSTVTGCDPPPGYAAAGDEWDCDDSSALAWPGAPEICGDGVDNNCNGDETECVRTGTVALGEADAILLGVSAGDRAGQAVDALGDVDGDGVDDIVVGAPYRDSGGSDSGSVHIVAGPILTGGSLGTARAELVANSAGNHGGWSVAGAGDLDHDGMADILIGGPSANGGGNDSGEAWVMYGPVSGEVQLGIADARLIGELAYDSAGISVAGGGDIDQDGWGDLLVGATGYGDSSDQSRGAVYLVSGPTTETIDLSASTARLVGEQRYDRFGTSVAIVGDTDGDGISDLVAGACTWPGNDANGAATLFLGPVSGALGATEAAATLSGEGEAHQAGYSVSGGDVDGDGYADVVVGAWMATFDEAEQGAAYVVAGPVSGAVSLSTARTRLLGATAREQAGSSVSADGDLNGDGRADVLVGSPSSDEVAADGGMAWLVYGPASGTASLADSDLVLTAVAARDVAGTAVAFAGDIDGDGLDDLLVGAPASDSAGSDAGAVYVVTGAGW